MNYIEPVLIGLITSLLTALASGIYFQIKRSKKQAMKALLVASINYYFKDIEVDDREKLDIVDEEIDRLRSKIRVRLSKRQINKSMFFDLNNLLNDRIHSIRIQFIKHLLNDHGNIRDDLDFIFSDGLISKAELLAVTDRIASDEKISEFSQKDLIEQIRYHCIEKNKILSNAEFLNSMGLDRHFFFMEYLSYVIFLIPVIGILVFGGIEISREPMLKNKTEPEKPSFTFGVVGFVSPEKMLDVTSKMSAFLSSHSGIKIVMKPYLYKQVNVELVNHIMTGQLDGFILNPGSYATLIMDSEEALKKSEMFCYHTEKGRHSYRSVIVTKKKDFESYCEEIGKPISYFNFHQPLDTTRRSLLRDYLLRGEIAFTHRNSMSGCMLPYNYLGREFRLFREGEKDIVGGIRIKYSDSHTNSLDWVKRGRIHAATIYDGYLSKEDTLDSVTILYSTSNIPYNSYWYLLDSDSVIVQKLKTAFLAMKEDSTVLSNTLGIDGWVRCSKDEYARTIEPSLQTIVSDFPKPKLVLNFVGETDFWNTNLPLHVRGSFSSFGYWDCVQEEHYEYDPLEVAYVVSLEAKKVKDHDVVDIVVSKNNIYQEEKLTLDITELTSTMTPGEGERNKSVLIVNALAELIAPTEIVYRDKGGCFIWLKEEASNCTLQVPGGGVISNEKVFPESKRAILDLDSTEMEQIAYKPVLLVYSIE